MTSSVLTRYQNEAESGIAQMRGIVAELAAAKPTIVGLNGSYARREVTSGSDVDLFVFVESESEIEQGAEVLRQIKGLLRSKGFKLAAEGGVFDQPLAIATLCDTIGGMHDSNVLITRRMLLLLEGEWLNHQDKIAHTKLQLIERYVSDKIRDEQIALFLLNDVIRYWRTICVDYEHKIGQGKAAEIRLLKLRFSRMLLYVGGLVAIGATHNLPASTKRTKLLELLALPPAQRIANILGDRSEPALRLYGEFLSAIDDAETRKILSAERSLGDYSEEYQRLRASAKRFREELKAALETTFPEPHPLLHSILL